MKNKKITAWVNRHVKESLAILAVLLTLIIELLSRKSFLGLLKFVLLSPHIFIYNSLIILFTLMLTFLFKRRQFAATVISLLWLAGGVANSILLVFRTTPFTAVDLKLIKYALSLLTNYLAIWQIILLAAVIVFCIVGCVLLFRKSTKIVEKVPYMKVVKGLLVLGLAVYGITAIGMQTGILAKNFGNLQKAYHSYGFAYCFSNSLLNTGISKPKGYSEEAIKEIEREMPVSESTVLPETEIETEAGKATQPADTGMPNIIFVQLESFFDPQILENIQLTEDPIPYFRKLMQEYSSGFLSVPSIGAGTANTEFEVITGMNLDFFGPGEYPYKTVLKETTCESLGYDLKDFGYRAHAIHNNEGTFYDRHVVFSQLGFDTFTPIEYMEQYELNASGWPKDEVLVSEIRRALNSTREKDFVYAITVQGHGAYPQEESAKELQIQATGMLSLEADYAFTYFVNQLKETDKVLEELVQMLEKRKERTVLVLYGDHLPSFEFTEEDLESNNLFQTNYVIWDNFGLAKEEKNVEAYQLSSLVLEHLDIHSGTMIRYHQKYLKEPYDMELYLEKMKMLEYDLLYGDKEAIDQQQFAPTKLQMGLKPIELNRMENKYDTTYFYGRGFTPFSQVVIDGKSVDTVFVGNALLVVKGLEFEQGKQYEIRIEQVGKDKQALGSTESFWYQN